MRVALFSVIAAVLFAVPAHAQSSGRLAPSVVYATDGWSPASVAIADVNGDGKPDLVVSNTCANDAACGNTNIANCVGCDGTVAVLLGVGDGTFQPPVTYDSGGYGPATVVIADVNGDGKPDIIVANQCVPPTPPSVEPCNGNNLLPGSLGVLLGNGDGTFQTAVAYPSVGSFGGALAVADVNGDGKLDAVLGVQCSSTSVCSGHSQVAVLLGNGDGTFRSPVTYDAGGYADESIAIQDVNGDGYPDIVTANQCSTWSCPDTGVAGVLLGNGDGTFRSAVSYHSSGTASSIAIADVNGDGKPDLLMGNFCQSGSCSTGVTVDVLLGNGDGTFRTATNFTSVGFGAGSVTVADVDSDGKPDLIVGASCDDSACDNNGTVSFLRGNGDGTFQTAVTYSTGAPYAKFAAAADVNGDAKPDIVVVNNAFSKADATNGSVAVLLNITGGNGPILSLSGNQLTFTLIAVGSTSTPQSVTLSNLGNASLPISSIQIVGAGAGSFDQTNDCGTSVASNGDCSINVVYKPTASGVTTAKMKITDGAPGSPHSISLTGSTDAITQAIVNPTSLAFGSVAIGMGGFQRSVTLTNTGTGVLDAPQVSASPSDFAAAATCSGPIQPLGNCVIIVVFAPTSTGAQSGTLTVTDNATGSPQIVGLTGTGVPGPPPNGPILMASPTMVNFPSQYVGTSGLPQTVTITNTGNATLTITGVTASPGDFGVLNNCINPVAQNTSCTIGVFFDPATGGTRTGTLSITDNATGSPQIVTLTGSGEDFSMAASSTPTANVRAGQTANYSITISPTSGFAQKVSLSCNGGPAMSTCSVSPSSVSLSGSAAKTVTVSVATSSQGFVSPFGGANRRQKMPLILLTTVLFLVLLLNAVSLLRPSRKLQWAPALTLLLLACLTATLASCGGGAGSSGSGSSAEAGTYTVTVTGNFSSGPANITHATELTLVVK